MVGALALTPPAPASAQDASAFVAQAQRCRTTKAPGACRLALEQSQRLKDWAEGRKLWRCYTAVLGAEAEMIAASLPGGLPQRNSAAQEMGTACGL